MALKKGICKNYDNCDLADNKEIQEVDSTEFKCRECDKDLHELYLAHDKTPGGGGGINKKLIGIIAAAVVVIGGGIGAYFGLGGNKGADSVDEVITDSVHEVKPDSVDVVKPAPKPVVKPSTSGSYSLGYGSYSGPTQGGVPHGAGGTITVNRNYQIDLKDGRGGMLEVNAGDKIVNTKFENGRLRSGELQRTDGTRKWFNC